MFNFFVGKLLSKQRIIIARIMFPNFRIVRSDERSVLSPKARLFQRLKNAASNASNSISPFVNGKTSSEDNRSQLLSSSKNVDSSEHNSRSSHQSQLVGVNRKSPNPVIHNIVNKPQSPIPNTADRVQYPNNVVTRSKSSIPNMPDRHQNPTNIVNKSQSSIPNTPDRQQKAIKATHKNHNETDNATHKHQIQTDNATHKHHNAGLDKNHQKETFVANMQQAKGNNHQSGTFVANMQQAKRNKRSLKKKSITQQ